MEQWGFSLDRDQMEITGQKHILISPQQEYLKRYQHMLLNIKVLVLSENSLKTVRSLSFKKTQCYYKYRDRRGRDRMVVGFTATYAISAYHH